MSKRISFDQAVLNDLELARRLGRRLWDETDLQFDFGGVERVSPEFAQELCRVIVERRSPAMLSNALLVTTMSPQIQATFFPAIMAAVGGGLVASPTAAKEPPAPTPTPAAPERPSATLNPFDILSAVQQNYRTYVQTFQQFQNEEIER